MNSRALPPAIENVITELANRTGTSPEQIKAIWAKKRAGIIGGMAPMTRGASTNPRIMQLGAAGGMRAQGAPTGTIQTTPTAPRLSKMAPMPTVVVDGQVAQPVRPADSSKPAPMPTVIVDGRITPTPTPSSQSRLAPMPVVVTDGQIVPPPKPAGESKMETMPVVVPSVPPTLPPPPPSSTPTRQFYGSPSPSTPQPSASPSTAPATQPAAPTQPSPANYPLPRPYTMNPNGSAAVPDFRVIFDGEGRPVPSQQIDGYPAPAPRATPSYVQPRRGAAAPSPRTSARADRVREILERLAAAPPTIPTRAQVPPPPRPRTQTLANRAVAERLAPGAFAFLRTTGEIQ